MSYSANPYNLESAPDCKAHFQACNGDTYDVTKLIGQKEAQNDENIKDMEGLTPDTLTYEQRAHNLIREGNPYGALKFAEEKLDVLGNPEMAAHLHAALEYYQYPEVAKIIADAVPEIGKYKPEQPKPKFDLDELSPNPSLG